VYKRQWQEGEDYLYINYAGDVILTKPISATSSLGNLLSILNTGTNKRQGRKIVIDEKYLRYASSLEDALKTKGKGLNNRRLAIGPEFNTVKVLVLNGPIIFFNTEGDINEQLMKLEALRRDELADGQIFNSQKYIDLRYGKSIFYK